MGVQSMVWGRGGMKGRQYCTTAITQMVAWARGMLGKMERSGWIRDILWQKCRLDGLAWGMTEKEGVQWGVLGR